MKSPIALAEFDASSTDIDAALTLPPQAFTSPEFYEFELEAVWGHEWFCLGRATDIPEPGDYYTQTVGHEPLVVLRDESGEVKVLSGVCRHRGMLLAQGRGNARRFRCPMHSWVYDLDGRLRSAPDMNPNGSFDLADERLPRVRSEVWEGFVFATFDDAIAPVAERLGRLAEQLANWEIGALRGAAPLEPTTGDWNWKIFADECYHCAHLHAKTWHRLFPTPPSAVDVDTELTDLNRGIIAYELLGREVGSSPTRTGMALHPLLPKLTERQLSRVHYVTVMPNLVLIGMPDKLKYFSWLPTGPTSSVSGFQWLFPEATMAEPGFRSRWDMEREDLAGVAVEDHAAWHGMQRGMESRFAPRGRFAPTESVVLNFNRWIIDKYRLEADRTRAVAGD